MKTLGATIFGGIIFFIALIFLSGNAMPDSGLYNFRRITEKGRVIITKNPQEKADLYENLLERRYQEIEYVVRTKQDRYILPSSLRYSTTAGRITDHIASNNLKQDASDLQNQFKRHKGRFLYLVSHYQSREHSNNFLQDAANYIDTYAATLKTVQ